MGVEQTSLDLKRGDTWSRTINFEDEDGSPIDITGWVIRLTAKAKIDDPDVSAVFSVLAVLSNAAIGEATISLTSTHTNQTVGSYLFDVQVTTNLSEIITVLEGIINISKDIYTGVS